MKAERAITNQDFWNQKPLTGETLERDDWRKKKKKKVI